MGRYLFQSVRFPSQFSIYEGPNLNSCTWTRCLADRKSVTNPNLRPFIHSGPRDRSRRYVDARRIPLSPFPE